MTLYPIVITIELIVANPQEAAKNYDIQKEYVWR